MKIVALVNNHIEKLADETLLVDFNSDSADREIDILDQDDWIIPLLHKDDRFVFPRGIDAFRDSLAKIPNEYDIVLVHMDVYDDNGVCRYQCNSARIFRKRVFKIPKRPYEVYANGGEVIRFPNDIIYVRTYM